MQIVLYAGLFWGGLLLGFLIGWWALHRFRSYNGVINIESDEIRDKSVYSLILYDDPESIRFENELLFKVDTSVEEADRE